jgi:hypothetical protein
LNTQETGKNRGKKRRLWPWTAHEENAPKPTHPGKAGKKIPMDNRRDF